MTQDERTDGPGDGVAAGVAEDPLAGMLRRERRAPRGRPGSLRWLREMLSRPLGLERRGNATHVVLKDRRRLPDEVRADAMKQLCNELGRRLNTLQPGTERQAMRHLVAVRAALVRRGWAGLQTAPSRVLAKAALQAQMLVGSEHAPRIQALVEHLRKLQVVAEVREDRIAHPELYGYASAVEVAETTPEAFAASEREWACTMSPGLDKDAPRDGEAGQRAA